MTANVDERRRERCDQAPPLQDEALADLRRKAEAATQGTWFRSGGRTNLYDRDLPLNGHTICRERDELSIAHVFFDKQTGEGLADAAHIAAFDPPTCLALLDRLATSEADRRALMEIAETARELITTGMVNRGVDRGLVVIEKVDKSDPHYRLCSLLARLPAPQQETSPGADHG